MDLYGIKPDEPVKPWGRIVGKRMHRV
jgi:hypothetical protein